MQTVTDPQTGASRQDYVIDTNGRREVRLVDVGDPITSRSLLTSEGIFWMLKSMVRNFVDFPPLGVVLVTMLGVGLAERAGLISALLKAVMLVVPARLFTPVLVFLGIQCSMGADSGYVVLPIAALMFKSVGRPGPASRRCSRASRGVQFQPAGHLAGPAARQPDADDA